MHDDGKCNDGGQAASPTSAPSGPTVQIVGIVASLPHRRARRPHLLHRPSHHVVPLHLLRLLHPSHHRTPIATPAAATASITTTAAVAAATTTAIAITKATDAATVAAPATAAPATAATSTAIANTQFASSLTITPIAASLTATPEAAFYFTTTFSPTTIVASTTRIARWLPFERVYCRDQHRCDRSFVWRHHWFVHALCSLHSRRKAGGRWPKGVVNSGRGWGWRRQRPHFQGRRAWSHAYDARNQRARADPVQEVEVVDVDVVLQEAQVEPGWGEVKMGVNRAVVHASRELHLDE